MTSVLPRIIKRELFAIISDPGGIIFSTVFVALSMALPLYFGGFFERDQADLQSLFSFWPWMFMIFIPALAMRGWADENRFGTIEMLMTWPVAASDWIIGKFLSLWAMMAGLILCTLPFAAMVGMLGDPDWGIVFQGYVGGILLAGAYISVALFASSLARHAVAAFVIGLVLCFVFTMAGSPLLAGMAGLAEWGLDFLTRAMMLLSVQNYFQTMASGVITAADILFFASFILFWQWLTWILIQRRYRG